LEEIIERSVNDKERKGCMVNSALELAPHDAEFQRVVTKALKELEAFFLRCVVAGQADGTITKSQSAEDLAKFLLSVLLGVRVLARTRPNRALLEGLVRPVYARLGKARH
jgi:TetR/AcrR family transcriptional repressor of nem operon